MSKFVIFIIKGNIIMFKNILITSSGGLLMLREYYFEQLDFAERQDYYTILNALQSKTSQIRLSNFDGDSVNKIWKAVVLDHPEIISYAGLVLGTFNGDLIFNYSETDEMLFEEKLNKLLDSINRKLKDTSSEYIICKTIYDTLAKKIKYNYKVLGQFYQLRRENCSQERMAEFLIENTCFFTPYGALVNGKAVCQGIAKLFKIICERFGIECACIQGKSVDNKDCSEDDHMLNVVEINGERAIVDLTNGLIEKNLPVVKYNYFLCSARVIKREYLVDAQWDCCNNENLSYFARKSLRFTTKESLRQYLTTFTSYETNSEIRIFYDGKKWSDKKLDDFCSSIISDHCAEGRQIEYKAVRKGFYTTKIIYSKEG